MIRNQEIAGTFVLGPLFLKWVWYLSLCCNVNQQEDRHLFKILLRFQQSLYAGVHFLKFVNSLACKCLQMLQLTPYQVFQIQIISFKENNLSFIICEVYCRHQGRHLMQQKSTLLALHWPGRLLLFKQMFGCVLGILLYNLGSS